MSPEPPYPGSPSDPTVTYTLREIIDQINRKLDILPGLAHQISEQEARSTEDRAALRALEVRVDVLEQVNDQSSARLLFKDRAWARLLGMATLIGGVAGGVTAVVRLVAG